MALGLEDTQFAMEDEEEIRRRLLEQQLTSPTANITDTGLDEQAITAEGGEEPVGPTPEVPFRYTQQELNPRGGAVTGLSQRDARARSAAGGLDFLPGGEFIMGLPTRDVTFGTGDNTFGGRVFDMPSIARQMGIDEARAQEILRLKPRSETTYHSGSPREGNYQSFGSRGDAERFIDQQYQGRDSGEPDYSGISSTTRQIPVRGLSDQEQIYRGIAATFADSRTDTMQAFMPRASDKARGQDTASLMELGRKGRVINPENMTREQYESQRRSQDRWFRNQGQQEGDELQGNIMKGIAMAIPAIMASIVTWGAASPALIGAYGTLAGGAMAGGLAGGAGGLVGSLTQGAASGNLSFGNVARSTGMGILGGAVGGGVAGAFGGGAAGNTGLSFQAPGTVGRAMLSSSQATNLGLAGLSGGAGAAGAASTTGGTGLIEKVRDFAQSPAGRLATGAAQGGAKGYQEHQAASMARQDMMSSAGQVSGGFGRGIQKNPMFQQRLPENEFYDPVEDVLSAQGGAVG